MYPFPCWSFDYLCYARHCQNTDRSSDHSHCFYITYMSLLPTDIPCYRRDRFGVVGPLPDDGNKITNFRCPQGNSGFYSCCVTGDTCVGNSICHFTHSQTDGSGFYLAGCTDKSYQNLLCTNHCSTIVKYSRKKNVKFDKLTICGDLQRTRYSQILLSSILPVGGPVAERTKTVPTPAMRPFKTPRLPSC